MALPKVVAPTYELELPSNGKKIKYRPFLVKEEKVLLIALDSKDEKQATQAMGKPSPAKPGEPPAKPCDRQPNQEMTQQNQRLFSLWPRKRSK